MGENTAESLESAEHRPDPNPNFVEENVVWSTKLFQCCLDRKLCLITGFVPMVTESRVGGKTGQRALARVVLVLGVSIVALFSVRLCLAVSGIRLEILIGLGLIAMGLLVIHRMLVAKLRSEVRKRADITKGGLFRDFCVVFWCYKCALCQMKREIDLLKKKKESCDVVEVNNNSNSTKLQMPQIKVTEFNSENSQVTKESQATSKPVPFTEV